MHRMGDHGEDEADADATDAAEPVLGQTREEMLSSRGSRGKPARGRCFGDLLDDAGLGGDEFTLTQLVPGRRPAST